MHRMKIGLFAAIVLLAVTAGVYVATSGDLKASVTRKVEDNVSRAQRLHHQINRLEGIDFANLSTVLARKPAVVAIFDKEGEAERREAAFSECEVANALLAKEGRKADIVAILDPGGKVVARDLNPNALYGEDLRAKYPAVDMALKGVATKDIWNFSNRMHRVAIAPITRPDGTTAGALLLGNVLTAKEAQAKRDLLGTQVAYFHAGKVHTSSFVSEGTGDNAKEDGNKTHALNGPLFQSADNPALAALNKGGPTEVFRFKLEGREYAAVAAPMPGNATDKSSGVVVMKSIDDEVDAVSGAGTKVIGFGLLAVLVALGAAVMTAVRFIKPLDKIELGVAEIINGNIDYTFKPVGPDFEGLSNGLNVMLARLLGREEPNEDAIEDDEEAEASKWRSDQMYVEDVAPGQPSPSTDPAVMALAQENEGAYHPRVFGEYLAALKSKGKPTEGITVQAFTAKLRLIEGGLKQKWSCKAVRFRVMTNGDQVTLKPVPIY